jgi:hypothetical protein
VTIQESFWELAPNLVEAKVTLGGGFGLGKLKSSGNPLKQVLVEIHSYSLPTQRIPIFLLTTEGTENTEVNIEIGNLEAGRE